MSISLSLQVTRCLPDEGYQGTLLAHSLACEQNSDSA